MALNETDILIEPMDFKIVLGDMFIGDSNNENIKHLCIANPGQFVISPIIGAALYRMQNTSVNDGRGLAAFIREQLRNDGYDEIRITGQSDAKTSETNLQITAVRTRKPQRLTI